MKLSRKQKAANKKQFLKSLRKACIYYHFNPKCSWHYYIDRPFVRGIHFWPTTGKWFNTKTGDTGTGIATLLTEVKFMKEYQIEEKEKSVSNKTHYQVEKGSRPLTEAQHRQRKIMAHFGMDFG